MMRGTAVPINSKLLKWAIKESGYGLEDVADRLQVSPDDIRAWILDQSKPRLTQFRKIAVFLKQPEALFFLSEPPQLQQSLPAFRHPRGDEHRDLNPRERRCIREAQRLQRGISWMLGEMGRAPEALPKVRIGSDPERAAKAARHRLGVTPETQIEYASESKAQHGWRAALEASGILVLLLPLGDKSTRGFSLYDDRAPLIAANTSGWNATARIFTFLHEYGHLVTRTSSICVEGRHPTTHGDEVERWCEAFAAAVLLPWTTIESLLTEQRGWQRDSQVRKLEDVSWLARKLNVSLRATAIRLIEKGVAEWSLYHEIPPSSDHQVRGGGGEGRHRPQIRVDEYGKRTARVLLDALEDDVISTTDAMGYLNVYDTELEDVEILATST